MLHVHAMLNVHTACPFCKSLLHVPAACPLCMSILVPDLGKGVCADPVNGGAILGKGGPDPQGGSKERQLSPDKGRDKT
jgi:hypothetical protein